MEYRRAFRLGGEHREKMLGPAQRYPVMEREIKRRGIQKQEIAGVLGLSVKALYNKMTGRTEFTWREVCTLQARFFPDMEKDELMREPPP